MTFFLLISRLQMLYHLKIFYENQSVAIKLSYKFKSNIKLKNKLNK